MKVKKILSAVISAAMCFSMFATNVSADNEIDYAPEETALTLVDSYGENSVTGVSGSGTTFRYEDIVQQTSHINTVLKSNNDSGIATYAENSAPVAGLTNMVVNPETMLNGKPTTETVVYWLWYDGETRYSYHPDGYEIVDYFLGGIDTYIIGQVTLEDEIIGFATQITKAAEHDLYFQVVDENGNFSEELDLVLEVEPSDGNTRPVCHIITATQTPYKNDNVFFDWSTSSDADGDQITGAEVKVYHNGGYEKITANSRYYSSMSNYGITLTFPDTGIYEIWISLSDSKNAWSNWAIGRINVINKPVVTPDEPVYVDPIMTLSGTWQDSVTIWTNTRPSRSRHTVSSSLSNVHVYRDKAIKFNKYTNNRGTYYNVVAYVIAPDTQFMSYEAWAIPNQDYYSRNFNDLYFGDKSPRNLTLGEINTLLEDEELIYVVYDPSSRKIVDFLSILNPLIARGINEPDIS